MTRNQIIENMKPELEGQEKLTVNHGRQMDQSGDPVGPDYYALSRFDGLVIGSVVQGTLKFGSDEVFIRSFLDDQYALMYLKQLCRDAADRQDVDFLVSEADPQQPRLGTPARRRM